MVIKYHTDGDKTPQAAADKTPQAAGDISSPWLDMVLSAPGIGQSVIQQQALQFNN